MSDIKYDNDFNKQELIRQAATEGENLEKETHVARTEVDEMLDPTLDELEAVEIGDNNHDDRSAFVHRTKEEALKQYVADGVNRKNKGHN